MQGTKNSQYLRHHRQLRATRRDAAVRHQPTEASSVSHANLIMGVQTHSVVVRSMLVIRNASSVIHANRIMGVQTHRVVVRSMLVIRVIVTGITRERALIARSCSVVEAVAINKASG